MEDLTVPLLNAEKSKPKLEPANAKKVSPSLKFLSLVRIMFGKTEFGILFLHSLLLIYRSILSVRVAKLDGYIANFLINRNLSKFLLHLGYWMALSIPATLTNSLLNFFQSYLSLRLRNNLTHYIHNIYLKDKLFYKVSNLDDRIKNCDQLITQDVLLFTNQITIVYSNILKPVFDVSLYMRQLSLRIGGKSVVGIFAWVNLTSAILYAISPSFGALVKQEQVLEGEYRFRHARLIENHEEIAFYSGYFIEKSILADSFKQLMLHVDVMSHKRLFYNTFEEFIIKYLWGSAGLLMCGYPVFKDQINTLVQLTYNQFKSNGFHGLFDLLKLAKNVDYKGGIVHKTTSSIIASRMEEFTTNRRLLMNGSDAFGRILYSFKDVAELKGYTDRVHELITVLEDVRNGQTVKQLVGGDLLTVAKRKLYLSSSDNLQHTQRDVSKFDILKNRGLIKDADYIQFDNVPVISPNGDVLLRSLSIFIKSGNHVLIIGPNGCGKSSLFRILGGLWPVYGGVLSRPRDEAFFYIPQRPYLSAGTFRDQIIYPHTLMEMKQNGVTDDDLYHILEIVQIEQLAVKEGWDTEKDWKDVLSGGDKQRIAAARLFYHKPKFAILDECTSAVSMDIERIIYTHCKSLGITLMTVSHRSSLWQYHNYILQYDGSGGYVYCELDAEKRLELQEEKQNIEHQLAGIPKLEQRLTELETMWNERKSPLING